MIKFTYTKPNGEISERVGIVVHKPTDLYSILDLSELDKDELSTMQETFKQYETELRELRKKYGLDLYWKNFKADRMSEVTTS
jgi:hypothetical protein